MTPRYEPNEIEAKWQRVWEDERAFNVPNPVPGEPTAENHWYQLEMLPYPSGPSLHMGHVLNYTMGDVQTHVRRRSGWHVVRPMGWDAFGLPAENAAIREGRHPRETIERNIETMRAQMKRLGWAIDWEREVSAHQPTFYRWTQWLFQQFVKHGLGYRKEGPVNWCPNDQTVIANEYIVDGRCERCGAEVELRNMTQWFFKTTAYADELLEYPGADWPERDPLPRRGDRRGRRRLHHACGHALRCDVLRRGARAPVCRGIRERRGEGVRAPCRRASGRGARGRDGEDRRLHRDARG
jgi:leucyl-tRNA synthetase